MKYAVLFVDDEANVLNAYKRNLRKYFDVHTALSGKDALELLEKHKDIAVIVTDMQMPSMNGVEFLEQARSVAKNSVRLMLTGNADQKTAIDAINQGDIFRFINKPCSPAEMLQILKLAIKQYQLIVAEQELLRTTLKKSIEALIETLSLACPESFGSVSRVKRHVIDCVKAMGAQNVWMYESMAMLAQLGYISLSKDIIDKLMMGQPLDDNQQEAFYKHSEVGYKLVSKIPRLEDVALAIRYQNKGFDGSGFPEDGPEGSELPVGSRILKIALDYERFEKLGGSAESALAYIHEHQARYDPRIFKVFVQSLSDARQLTLEHVGLMALKPGMVFAEDVMTDQELLLVSKGQEVTECVIDRFYNFSRHHKLPEQFGVYVSH
ncbi:HD domain-containing phosphohydrolase [Aliamphritea spongicola]|uniref:HD domain-containing phosphohydrolase n=1 Tax=Aliamphritea spongicola TaxID=707589 RepID=UPI00196B25C4|nr:HD domain-containing phosphohydrolase [Aliamphritea spongicola]MBN3560590.1 response regulator [Aliamphritea spongicola]